MAQTNELDEAFAVVLEAREQRKREDNAGRTLWRTHHWPERYERCMAIRGRHVCRRCTWMYTAAFAVVGLGLSGIAPWPENLDRPLVWALALPATIEFVIGELTAMKYDSRRQAFVTLLLGLGIGRGMVAELTTSGSTLFWGPTLTLGPIWFLAAVIGWFRRTGQYRSKPDE